MNVVLLTYISALVGLLCKVVSSVHGYGQHKFAMKAGLLVLRRVQKFPA